MHFTKSPSFCFKSRHALGPFLEILKGEKVCFISHVLRPWKSRLGGVQQQDCSLHSSWKAASQGLFKMFYLPLFLWCTTSENCILCTLLISYHPFDSMCNALVLLLHPSFFLPSFHIFDSCIKVLSSHRFSAARFLNPWCWTGCLTLALSCFSISVIKHHHESLKNLEFTLLNGCREVRVHQRGGRHGRKLQARYQE